MANLKVNLRPRVGWITALDGEESNAIGSM
jgi:hypothetical protein